jgi:hypothetical protein
VLRPAAAYPTVLILAGGGTIDGGVRMGVALKRLR